MSEQLPDMDVQKLVGDTVFDIGGEDQLAKLRKESLPSSAAGDVTNLDRLDVLWSEFLKNCHVKLGTLLKSDNVSFLLGAGASRHAGGVLLGKIPLEIEHQLINQGVSNGALADWLKIFYLAASRRSEGGDSIPGDQKSILGRLEKFSEAKPMKVNCEALLSLLYAWRGAIESSNDLLCINGNRNVDLTPKNLDACIDKVKLALTKCCELPSGKTADPLKSHKTFLKKILSRPLNLKRVNLFTLNYDTLIEQAADAEGVVLLDGFVGTIRRIFRPESYDQDLYFPAETTEGQVHRLDRVIHLYKLHGSNTWRAQKPDWDDPYGVSMENDLRVDADKVLIYPTPSKYGDILGMPYAELFRRFAASVVRPQSTLFVIGYGFCDDHVTAIIRQALAIPSFTLVIVDPYAAEQDASSNAMVARLRAARDRRIWVFSKHILGTFAGFVEEALPDLRDEEIMRNVIRTYNALRSESNSRGQEADANAG